MAAPGTARNRKTVLLLTLALVAFVTIVGLAAYVMWSVRSPPEPAPFVEFNPPGFGGPGDATVEIGEASRAAPLSQFRVSLRDLTASTTVFEAPLRVGTLYSGGGSVVSFEDFTDVGSLTVGDLFRLINLPTGATYSLILVYAPTDATAASVTIPL